MNKLKVFIARAQNTLGFSPRMNEHFVNNESLGNKKPRLTSRRFFIFLLILLLAAGIRLYKLDQVPPSLYWEEAALGYDAYSILETGRDHHGQSFPIVAFSSFGDYKPAGYFYALVPAIAVFGLNDFSVRLPSVVAGVLLVIVVGLLARRLVAGKDKDKDTVQLIAMTMAAISPWAIQFSRGGWEVNVATCLLSWGIYLGLTAWERKKTFMNVFYSCIAFLLLGLSMYTYHATRVIAPVLALGLLLVWLTRTTYFSFASISNIRRWMKENFKTLSLYFVSGLFFLLLISPLLLASQDKSTQQRFAETNIFADGKSVQLSNYYRDLTGNSALSRLIYHRFIFQMQIFSQNYLKHFSPQFLFISGDSNSRHSIQFFGLFYPLDAVFLLLGCFIFLKKRSKDFWFICLWFTIGIVPAALTQAAPHALRTLVVMPVYVLLITLGLADIAKWKIWQRFKIFQLTPVFLIKIALIIQFAAFWRFYMNIYPRIYSSDWQYGYSQMVQALASARAQDPSTPVYVTREYGRPAMYYWFYTQTDPKLVQAADATVTKDQGEFLEFENIHFVRSVNEAQPGIVASSSQGMTELTTRYKHVTMIREIKDLRNQTVWVISKVEK